MTSSLFQQATFFTTLCYSQGKWRRNAIKALLADGHELANHGEEDREYDHDTAQGFETALDSTDEFIFQMANNNVVVGSESSSISGDDDVDSARIGAGVGVGFSAGAGAVGSGSRRRRHRESSNRNRNNNGNVSSGDGGRTTTTTSASNRMSGRRRFRGSKWFRAPSASLSQTMSDVLKVSVRHAQF